MLLPAPTQSGQAVRDFDRHWDEHLGSEAARYERHERRLARRRAVACLVLAAGAVLLGLAGFMRETDTRLAPVRHVPSPGWVVVTLPRR